MTFDTKYFLKSHHIYITYHVCVTRSMRVGFTKLMLGANKMASNAKFDYFRHSCVLLGVARSINRGPACADPEILMRGGPTKKLIFGHRRGGSGGGGGGVQPPQNPEITFF